MDSTEKRKRFGRALRAARTAAGLSQTKLSVQIDKDQGIISDYEAGKTEPGVEAVVALEEALSLEPGSLSRYLGWIPVDPAEAPEPPNVTLRGLSNDQLQILAQKFMENMGAAQHVQERLADYVRHVEASMSGISQLSKNDAHWRKLQEAVAESLPTMPNTAHGWELTPLVMTTSDGAHAPDIVFINSEGEVCVAEVKSGRPAVTIKSRETKNVTVTPDTAVATASIPEPLITAISKLEERLAELEKKAELLGD